MFREEIVCRVCANHCTLQVEEKSGWISVTGHFCERGERFGKEEYLGERRVVSCQVPTAFSDLPMVEVRTTGPIPKGLIFKMIRHMKKLKITERPLQGELAEASPLGLPIDLIYGELS